MTTQAIPAAELREQAREVHPGRWLVTAVAAVFVAIGWVPGFIVTVIVFAVASVRFGYLRGRGWTDEEIAARGSDRSEQAPPERPSKL